MECALQLEKLVFDEIQFIRIGMRSENELKMSMEVNIGMNKSDSQKRKVTITFTGIKEEEYNIKIKISGFFVVTGSENEYLVENNAVAIVLPYLRSQITLLTAQPGVDPIVLPPMNVVEMLKENE